MNYRDFFLAKSTSGGGGGGAGAITTDTETNLTGVITGDGEYIDAIPFSSDDSGKALVYNVPDGLAFGFPSMVFLDLTFSSGNPIPYDATVWEDFVDAYDKGVSVLLTTDGFGAGDARNMKVAITGWIEGEAEGTPYPMFCEVIADESTPNQLTVVVPQIIDMGGEDEAYTVVTKTINLSGGGGAENVYIVTPGVTTQAQMDAARTDGKYLVAYDPTNSYTYANFYSYATEDYGNEYIFYGINDMSRISTITCDGQGTWGTNVDTDLATLHSPTFTGQPKAPTANTSVSNTQIATTAFVHNVVNSAITTALGGSY